MAKMKGLLKFSGGDKALILLCILFNAGIFLLLWIRYVVGQLGVTRIEIRDGKARILRSPCKLKVCIKSGYIQYADRISFCLPNRVERVEGNAERGLDAVVS